MLARGGAGVPPGCRCLRFPYFRFQSLDFERNHIKIVLGPPGTTYEFEICPDSID